MPPATPDMLTPDNRAAYEQLPEAEQAELYERQHEEALEVHKGVKTTAERALAAAALMEIIDKEQADAIREQLRDAVAHEIAAVEDRRAKEEEVLALQMPILTGLITGDGRETRELTPRVPRHPGKTAGTGGRGSER